jgi:hypothetical protein
MKFLFTASFFILVTMTCLSQAPTVIPADTLKKQLSQLQSKVDSIQTQLGKVQGLKNVGLKKSQGLALQKDIRDEQVKAIRICAVFMDRYAVGTKATDVILGALNTGITIGQLSSPFANKKFKDDYQKWGDKWGKFLPAIILPALSLLVKSNQEAQIGSVSLGLTITAAWSALSKSGKLQNNELTSAINNITQTMDLFDFNRTVYDDNQKLKAVIASVGAADPKLWPEFKRYWEKNKDILTSSNDEIKQDPRFPVFIDSTTVYLDRFQLKLARVNYVLDFAKGMMDSYDARYRLINADASNPVTIATAQAIADLKKTYSDNSKDWQELQGTFYKMTPGEARKLNAFYQLEEFFKQLHQ